MWYILYTVHFSSSMYSTFNVNLSQFTTVTLIQGFMTYSSTIYEYTYFSTYVILLLLPIDQYFKKRYLSYECLSWTRRLFRIFELFAYVWFEYDHTLYLLFQYQTNILWNHCQLFLELQYKTTLRSVSRKRDEISTVFARFVLVLFSRD